MSGDEFLFVPLGGAGEIGMNMSLYGYKNRWLMIDMGIAFADDSLPGIDVMTPDPAFIVERRNNLEALIITHAHEDHLGAVPYLWKKLKCPVYATPFAIGLLRRKLEEAGLLDVVELYEISLGGNIETGPFQINLISAAHSVPEANILVIKSEAGTVVHATDWKIDSEPIIGMKTDESSLKSVGDEGVLALICDSTNVFVEGEAGSEGALRDSLVEVIKKCSGRVAVASFASNVARISSVRYAANKTGRNFALVGRSMERIFEISKDCGYFGDDVTYVPETEIGFFPKEKIVMAVTGSQGEPRSALARIASGNHPNVSLEARDTVIFSSREIPGNEKAIGKVQNALARRGIDIITEQDGFIHVSGHPARDELQKLYQWVRPDTLIPIHGELRHLKEHAHFARTNQIANSIIAENGTVVRLAKGNAEVVDHIETGRLAVDGKRLISVDSDVIRERNRIRYNGVAVATVIINRGGKLLGEPQLSVRGVIDFIDENGYYTEAVKAIVTAINKLPEKRRDDELLAETTRVAVRRTLRNFTGKRPVTDVHIVRV